MTSLAIVDSGPLVAAANPKDPFHAASVRALSDRELRLVVPALCVAEVTYLVNRYLGPNVEAAFLDSLVELDVQAPATEEWPRMAELVRQYADFPLGGTDASVVALAERYRAEVIITLDHRHFAAIRPLHCERFRLLPV